MYKLELLQTIKQQGSRLLLLVIEHTHAHFPYKYTRSSVPMLPGFANLKLTNDIGVLGKRSYKQAGFCDFEVLEQCIQKLVQSMLKDIRDAYNEFKDSSASCARAMNGERSFTRKNVEYIESYTLTFVAKYNIDSIHTKTLTSSSIYCSRPEKIACKLSFNQIDYDMEFDIDLDISNWKEYIKRTRCEVELTQQVNDKLKETFIPDTLQSDGEWLEETLPQCTVPECIETLAENMLESMTTQFEQINDTTSPKSAQPETELISFEEKHVKCPDFDEFMFKATVPNKEIVELQTQGQGVIKIVCSFTFLSSSPHETYKEHVKICVQDFLYYEGFDKMYAQWKSVSSLGKKYNIKKNIATQICNILWAK